MPKKKKVSASSEDYLEAILLICKKKGEARHKDIVLHLGVSGPSVTEALNLLSQKGLVHYTPYNAITLTEEGEKIAEDVYHRHETLRDFFIEVLGIDPETAEDGACKMEHAASPKVIERMVKYTHFMRCECHHKGQPKIECFLDFLENQEH